MEDFDLLMDQVNESISEKDRNGRILTHLIHELLNDLVPNYCFNSSTQRFLKASVLFTESAPKRSFPKAKLMHLYGTKVFISNINARTARYLSVWSIPPTDMFFPKSI